MMYNNNFVASILVNGRISKEDGNVVKVPFGNEFAVRLRNKLNNPAAVDLYVNGTRVNQVGQLLIPANSHLDIDRWVFADKTDRKLIFVKSGDSRVSEPGESENGHVEARFYELNDSIQTIETHIHHHDYWPYYIYVDRYYAYPKPYMPYIHPEIIWCDTGYTISNITLAGGRGRGTSAGSITLRSSSDLNTAVYGSNDTSSYIAGGMNSVCSSVSDNIALTSNGAVAEGDKVDTKKEFEKFNKPVGMLKGTPTIMKLILQGYSIPKSNKCKKCGNMKRTDDKFCSRCGCRF